MRFKKMFMVLLSLIITLSLVACGSPTQETTGTTTETTVTSGTYTGSAPGHNGPVSVDVTIDEDGTISDIQIVESSETLAIGSGAYEITKNHVLVKQNLDVEAISGATISRAAYINAIADALGQAGFDVDALKESTGEVDDSVIGDLETEVLVIGGGIAGFSAAIEANSLGANVILIEKLGVIGGTTARSEGIVQAAGTELQKEHGIDDSEEQFYIDFTGLQTDETLDDDLIRLGIENSVETIEWLKDKGVNFDEIESAHSLPPRDIMRGHYAENKGGGMMQTLYEYALDNGVEVYTNTKATEIIMKDGAAVGAKVVRSNGEELTISAQAVVIATGGYSSNKELMAKLHPEIVDYTSYNSNTGDGYLLAEKAGAEMINKSPALVHYANRLPGATGAVNVVGFYTPTVVLVTEDGLRYSSEEAYTFDRSGVVIAKGASQVFALLPNEFVSENQEGVDNGVEKGIIIKSESIEDLAKEYGIDADNLVATIENYNELCDKGKDDDFNKDSKFLKSFDGPEYYAMRLYPSVAETYNGPKITVNGEVISTDGNPIPGLYAAGGVTMAQFTDYQYYSSGTAILYSAVIGREAANHIVENVLNK